ncbi:protein gp37 [Rhizobium subbaraonis]|uniref:Protein gp37 n=1 Tax=Rhizobium subbaraonis TaxID=908946 RepID=A0A285UWI7_9HYPH|nr:phage Gp37/Gp68 family protein [Rhizobium subbaraonis]SOC46254.1 protein gp37 [Rhizobium subbaraonis]
MADNTKIEWTDATWNPITGCSIVSPGCTNCYAMKLAGTRLRHHPSRAGLTKDSKAGPVWTGEVRFNREWLDQPLRWRRPRMIFVCAHGDLFAEGVPDEWIDQVFVVMALSPQHTFQVLTKRPERMRAYLTRPPGNGLQDVRNHLAWEATSNVMNAYLPGWKTEAPDGPRRSLAINAFTSWPLPNVWLGVSVEDQKRAEERIPVLLDTPAAIRWISAEPLLGPVDIGRWTATAEVTCKACQQQFWLHSADPCEHEAGGSWTLACPHCAGCRCKPGWTEADARAMSMEPPADWIDRQVGRFTKVHPTIKMTSLIHWVVVGGESGHGARPMQPEWAESLRDQCAAAGVPFLFKQWGSHKVTSDCNGRYMIPATKKEAGRLLDGIEHNGFPEVRR